LPSFFDSVCATFNGRAVFAFSLSYVFVVINPGFSGLEITNGFHVLSETAHEKHRA
jgi:hypothetical protein